MGSSVGRFFGRSVSPSAVLLCTHGKDTNSSASPIDRSLMGLAVWSGIALCESFRRVRKRLHWTKSCWWLLSMVALMLDVARRWYGNIVDCGGGGRRHRRRCRRCRRPLDQFTNPRVPSDQLTGRQRSGLLLYSRSSSCQMFTCRPP